MATRKSNGLQTTGSAPPTEVALRAATQPPTTITPPNVIALYDRYRKEVAPLEGLQVVDNDSFVKAGLAFQATGHFIDDIETAFKSEKTSAHRAWKGITTLESMFIDPASLVKQNLDRQILAWKDKLDAERIAEEQRLQRQEQARAEAERLRLQQIADADAKEHRQQIAEAQLDLMPWEEADDPIPEPVAVVIPVAEVPEVRLPSTVPNVMGLNYRQSPWKARIDLKALVIAAGKRAEAGDDSFLQYLEAREPLLNSLCSDHGESVSMIVPGVTAFRETRLARG